MSGFGERLAERARQGSSLVVGIDPHPTRMPVPIAARWRTDPAGALEAWSIGVLEAVGPYVAAVKPQAAFYEAYGSVGWRALESVCARAKELGVPVLLDAKRGDIGSTAEAYARGLLDDDGPLGADAVTVSPWLGPESLEPFVARAAAGKGVFVLVRTSNPGAEAWQIPAAERVAAWIAEANASLGGRPGPVGAVVGATLPGGPWRALLGDAWILAPGIGAQGAGVDDLSGHRRADGGGVLPVAARSVLFADQPEGDDWTERVARRALALTRELAPWENAG